ncbi:U3 small nucleolar RNA-associated protein 6-domain-containing protein [Panaeolus papilionaceus]|nr:U3 small nucleolar RNA-associated protein 6-domain-containing protein [Panaeolus papilionaceus]
MERVQFQQEQMLNELKDLVEKNLFTEKEAKQIMKQRTIYETALVRRVARKADFLRYAAYEMSLEQLRRKRVERMKLKPAPASISDYALVKRQFDIFERAVRKFKSDVGLWVQYIQVAKREGARSLVGRITARALQMHPNNPSLFILAASHELEHHSPSAARTLMQRGIRLNPESIDLWKEYVKMELGYIESLRRRWEVLGIKTEKKKEDGDEAEREEEQTEEDSDVGAEARRKVMEGGIVASVVSSAGQAIPRVELFASIKEVIAGFPTTADLRKQLLNHLYDQVLKILGNEPKAIVFRACRFIGEEGGTELILGLDKASEEIRSLIGKGHSEYVKFVEEWCKRVEDVNMVLYLKSSLL